jgi:GNAT superfamily N-acetyltransferase
MNIRPVEEKDFPQWQKLWEGYNQFYKRVVPIEVTNHSWKRFLNPSIECFSYVAENEGELIGLANFLYHLNTSLIEPICYLQDLFTLESERGKGVGRALIVCVYNHAKERSTTRVYWHTQETNHTARILYDKVAVNSGFIMYRKALQ